jgi:hypothetical protein|tara:strand:- start:2893 stop:3492 length:600 start_codon:yes stop_codon:yes gene_type:complete
MADEDKYGCSLITKGRGLDCNRSSGGVKAVYFAVGDTTKVTQSWTGSTAGTTIDINMGGTSLYKYSLPKGTATMTDTIVGSQENGTIYYTPTIQILLNKIKALDQNEIRLLGQTQTVIFVEMNSVYNSNQHNVIVCLGPENWMTLDAGTSSSGTAWGDRNGYDLTFGGMESLPISVVADYTLTPFDNIDSGALIPIIAN